MIEITFEINGRKVNPNKIGNEIEKSILQQVSNDIKKALSSVRCQEHGQAPSVTVKGKSLDNLSFEVKGCCQELIDEALKKLQ